MMNEWKNELARLFAQVRSVEEAKDLLEQMLSPKEFQEIAKRWQIVKLLFQGTRQTVISRRVEVGVATVTRGSREVKHGKGVLKKFYKRMYS